MAIRFLRHYVHLPFALLAVVETALLFGCAIGATYLRLGANEGGIAGSWSLTFWRSSLFAGATLVWMISMGLYSARQRARIEGIIMRVGAALIGAVLLVALISYFFPDIYFGRGVLALAALGAMTLLCAVRVLFARVVDENIFKRRVLVYGAGKQAMSISQLRRRADQRGFSVVGYVAAEGRAPSVAGDRLVDPQGPLSAFAEANEIDEIVVAMDERRQAFPVHDLLECRLAGVEVTDLVSFLERETGKVRLDVLNPSWMIFARGFSRDPWRQLTSRSFDVTAALVLLVLLSPLMVLTALGILLEDGPRAPVFYRQRRVGKDGREFNLLKFRSMRPDAESDGKARWAQTGDARVTRVGGVIRKTRLDELPQLLIVLSGAMSFVGPRPERPEFVASLSETIPYYRERHCVKPGITGWAQLCYPYGSSERDAMEKLQYDLYYVKNHSLVFDLMILLQTVEVVVLGKGAR
ncbi:MAG: TIGR03013 family XrtA/PEP-CTERM system glycosyltransferase [Steroidobacterales bacterium]